MRYRREEFRYCYYLQHARYTRYDDRYIVAAAMMPRITLYTYTLFIDYAMLPF